MDPVALAIFGGLAAFTILLIAGLLLWNRRDRLRAEAARAATVVRAPVAGPAFNRRVAAWLVPTYAFSFAAGALTSKHGPIPASSGWFAAALGIVLVVGSVGAGLSAMRAIGVVELDRAQNTLRFRVNGADRIFDLGRAFDYGEYALPPVTLSPQGGTAVLIRQGGTSASFWYPIGFRDLRDDRPALVDAPPEYLRCKDRLGRVIHEHLSGLAKNTKPA